MNRDIWSLEVRLQLLFDINETGGETLTEESGKVIVKLEAPSHPSP